MSEISAEPTLRIDAGGRVAKNRFFMWLNATQLGIVLIGFSPSFYLRGHLIPWPENPAILTLHGLALTTWFVLMFIQSLMIVSGRLRWHRMLGLFGLGVALTIVVTTIPASFYALNAIPVGYEVTVPVTHEALVAEKAAGFANNFGLIVIFSLYVVLAFVCRSKPDIHKRLLLIASIMMTTAAAFRWFLAAMSIGVSDEVAYVIGITAGMVLPFVLLASVFVFDLIAKKRVLRVTLLAGVGAIAIRMAAFAIFTSDPALLWFDSLIYITV